MCVVSMVGDHYRDTFPKKEYWPGIQPHINPPPHIYITPQEITRAEFDALKKDVEEMKELLKRAKKYDEETGQPDCEMDEKVALLKQVAKLVGVDLSEIFGEKHA